MENEAEPQYIQILLSTLSGDTIIPFDLHILVAEKYVLYCRQEGFLDQVRLDRLRKKGITHLFINSLDAGKYRSFLNADVQGAYDKTREMPLDARCEVIGRSLQFAIEDVFAKPQLYELVKVLENGARHFLDFLTVEGDAPRHLLAAPPDIAPEIAIHGVRVGTLALALSFELGLQKDKPALLVPFLLGNFLHDIGLAHKSIDLKKETKNFSASEKTLYDHHPAAGVTILQNQQHLSPLTIQIILGHHECADGSGFPKRLVFDEVDPLVLIASLANAYDRLVYFQKWPHHQARQIIAVDGMGRYPLEYLQALEKVIKGLYEKP